MQRKYRFWVPALAFLAFLSVLAPQQALAAASVTDPCPPDTDKTFAHNLAAIEQDQSQTAAKVAAQYPLPPVVNACVQNIMTISSQLPGLADPLSVLKAVETSIVNSVVNQACSQVLGSITSVQDSITNITKICLPIPTFGVDLNLPKFSASACTGGTQLSTLTPFSSANTSASWSVNKFLHRP